MTIEEAIQHCLEVYTKRKLEAAVHPLLPGFPSEDEKRAAEESAERHLQLANWLRELVDLREQRDDLIRKCELYETREWIQDTRDKIRPFKIKFKKMWQHRGFPSSAVSKKMKVWSWGFHRVDDSVNKTLRFNYFITKDWIYHVEIDWVGRNGRRMNESGNE